MVAGFNTTVNGINTFYKHLFDVFDEANVCVDILNVAPVDRGLVDIDDCGVVGNIVNIWDGKEDLKKRFKESEEMFPFLSKVGVECCSAISSYVRFQTIHQMMQNNIYDAIFNNDGGYAGVTALSMYYPFHKMIDVYEYTHNSLLFMPKEEENMIKAHTAKMAKVMRYSMGEGYYLISQRDMDNIVMENKKKIGMLLDCEKFHSYQLPVEKKEDRVLYIGRMDKSSKNPELWFKTVAETGLSGLVIVPSAKNAKEAEELAGKYGITDCEVYHSISFDEKLKQSARCKCFFISSKHEMFGYTIYENLNLMPVVAPNVYWANEVQRELPSVRIPKPGERPADLIMGAVRDYSEAGMEKQYGEVIRYRDETRAKWLEFLKNIPERRGKDSHKKVKNVELLETCKTLGNVLRAAKQKMFAFEELDIIYRCLNPQKIIQTREKTYYGDIIQEAKTEKNNSLDAFFSCNG